MAKRCRHQCLRLQQEVDIVIYLMWGKGRHNSRSRLHCADHTVTSPPPNPSQCPPIYFPPPDPRSSSAHLPLLIRRACSPHLGRRGQKTGETDTYGDRSAFGPKRSRWHSAPAITDAVRLIFPCWAAVYSRSPLLDDALDLTDPKPRWEDHHP
nr:uncharacterized protein LOC113804418 [Penaeus vannamei]